MEKLLQLTPGCRENQSSSVVNGIPGINFSHVLTQQKVISIAYPLYLVFLPSGEETLSLFSEELKTRKAQKGSQTTIRLLLTCVFIVFFHHFDKILGNSQITRFIFFICKYTVKIKKIIYKAKRNHHNFYLWGDCRDCLPIHQTRAWLTGN